MPKPIQPRSLVKSGNVGNIYFLNCYVIFRDSIFDLLEKEFSEYFQDFIQAKVFGAAAVLILKSPRFELR